MTPEEAVDVLVRTGVTRNDRANLRLLFGKVAATAKATETRRCAARVTQSCNATCDTLMIAFGKGMANDILTTGRHCV